MTIAKPPIASLSCRIRKPLLLLLCAALLLLLTGCWNRRELDTLGIALGFGIDKTESAYRVSVQVVDPGQVSVSRPASPGHPPTVLFHSESPSLYEALRKMTEVSPRKIYLSHIRVLILGEEIAREGVGKVLDMLSRDAEFRTDFYLFVAKHTTAENVLKIFTPLSNIPAYKMYDALLTSSRTWAPSATVTLDQFMSRIVGPGLNPVLTAIEVAGDQKKGELPSNVSRISASTMLRTKGLAIFDKDKLVGWFNEEESIGYNYIMNQVKSTITKVPCESNGLIALENIHSVTRLKSRVRNGSPVIKVKLNSQVNIGEVQCDFKTTEPENIRKLKHSLEQKRIEMMDSAVEKARELHVDAFGFGNAFYRNQPAYWRKAEKDWDALFQSLRVDYDANIQILKVGTVFDPFHASVKE
ncbi:Ger(x)C family spore germination protein [Cohnella sp. AR92]|uniref:Ger(x)C family spore germination protein n=1 Tax=Cohnella sp. AR92 TaxID=648716 RepID=UPI000F8F56D3|nr:Ger(x)C family spore germination protein [Cohnella sp. AR92]RUS46710.1 Ger(x)C family spore germination protein [Cohnella sp. AR92]